jgi:hypothetical protein
VAEVHDCFTITELLMYEALGFAGHGEGAGLAAKAAPAHGDLPVNTGGGLVGFGHPVGATGVKQLVELWRQMKGRCGDYQVPSPRCDRPHRQHGRRRQDGRVAGHPQPELSRWLRARGGGGWSRWSALRRRSPAPSS